MQRQSIDRQSLQHRVEDTRDLSWMRDADRIADGDFVDAQVREAGRDVRDAIGRDLAFERTSERRGKIAAYAQPCRTGAIADLSVNRQRLVDTPVDVLLTERF